MGWVSLLGIVGLVFMCMAHMAVVSDLGVHGRGFEVYGLSLVRGVKPCIQPQKLHLVERLEGSWDLVT